MSPRRVSKGEAAERVVRSAAADLLLATLALQAGDGDPDEALIKLWAASLKLNHAHYELGFLAGRGVAGELSE